MTLEWYPQRNRWQSVTRQDQTVESIFPFDNAFDFDVLDARFCVCPADRVSQIIKKLSADFELPVDAEDAVRRVKLAEWLTAEANPLFPRVIVNRLWHYHFGRGIIATPNDLGFNGGLPSHPELLDWLALELQRNNFRLKPLADVC